MIRRAYDIIRNEGFEDLREQLQANLEEGLHQGPYNPDMAWETSLSVAVADKDCWAEHATDIIDVVGKQALHQLGPPTTECNNTQLCVSFMAIKTPMLNPANHPVQTLRD